MRVPLSDSRVATGYFDNIDLTVSMPSFKFTLISVSLLSSSVLMSGMYCAGLASSLSMNTPSLFIFANCCLSALQLTPIDTGHDAPCLNIRITRTSWQNYLPPNWAPMPKSCVILSTFFSVSMHLNARPNSFPLSGKLSR